MQKIIVVIGATGSQGGSVVRCLLQNPEFKLRAVTRKPISPAAKEMSSQGVEVVAGDLGNKDSLRRAFKDAWGVFGVTNFWEHSGKEVEHGTNMIDVAKECGVSFFVWSSVDHQPKDAQRCESKDRITLHLKESGLHHAIFYPTCYMENITNMWMSKEDLDGNKSISIPMPSDTPILWYSVQDTGKYVKDAFEHPERYASKEIRAGSEWVTPRKVVELLNESTGRKYKLEAWDEDKFARFAGEGTLANEIHAMMTFMITHPQDHVIRKKEANVPTQSMRDFVTSNHKVIMGEPRMNLRGSSTYIPTPLRSSKERVALPAWMAAN